jgi:hypothetical protein
LPAKRKAQDKRLLVPMFSLLERKMMALENDQSGHTWFELMLSAEEFANKSDGNMGNVRDG